jgi:alpha-beta hydrolase superfamily lysophospholipase
MLADTFHHEADDGAKLHVYRWLPDAGVKPRGLVHIAHGMAEHAGRYARVAEALTAAGYVVYANDHRGHGKTAKTESDLGYFAEGAGWERVVRDLDELITREAESHAGLGVVLFGHSMGSFMTQQFLIEHGGTLHGAVLSGSGGKPGALAAVGKVVARIERLRLGERGKSTLIDSMSFEQFNRAFRPNRTRFDWLSRDEAVVDRYIADPLCGFVCTATLWGQLLQAMDDIARPTAQARISKNLPIYVFSGSQDPVGENTKSVQRLLKAYERAGLRRVTHRFYAGGRHEMLNETNRDEVTADLVRWLDATFEASS